MTQHMISRHILVGIVLILCTSCYNTKRLNYLDSSSSIAEQIGKEYLKKTIDYKLKAGDVLSVLVHTDDADVNAAFNLLSQSGGSSGAGGSDLASGYAVNDTGYVNLPVIGSFKVTGLTLNEVRQSIQERAEVLLVNPYIVVRLLSFRLILLGEIMTQGVMPVSQDRINVIEAIALAGGVTDYGNREKILILRETGQGYKSIYIDVSKRSILSSENFYLQPNDIIYIEPLPTKNMQLTFRDYSLFITIISTTVTSVLLVFNLFKP